jgi:hypothetical protein
MNRADRRFRRQRKIARAIKVMRQWGLDTKMAPYWADNMRKCSCYLCQKSGKPEHDFDMYEAAREWE